MKAGVNAEVVEAFDINNVANDVYQHNFGHRPYQVFLSLFSSSCSFLSGYLLFESISWLLFGIIGAVNCYCEVTLLG